MRDETTSYSVALQHDNFEEKVVGSLYATKAAAPAHTAGLPAAEVSIRTSVVGRTTCGLVVRCLHAAGERATSCRSTSGKAASSHTREAACLSQAIFGHCSEEKRITNKGRCAHLRVLTPGGDRSNKSSSLFAAVCSLRFREAKRSYFFR